MRKILLQVTCEKVAGGCCGGSRNKPSIKYAILDIEADDPYWKAPEHMKWKLLKASPLMGNMLTLGKKHGAKRPDPPWAGTVVTLGLHKDPDFLAQLRATKTMKKGCEISE